MSDTKNNVTLLPNVSLLPARREPVAKVVQCLEEWLDAARKGDLTSISLAGVFFNGDTQTETQNSDGQNDSMMAAICYLKIRFGQDMANEPGS